MDLVKWRCVGQGGHRTAEGKRVAHGDVFLDVPDLDQRFPGKFERHVRAAAPDPDEDEDREGEGEGGGIDVEQYATGGNWYDIPGHGKVQGKDAALAALQAG